MRHNAACLVRLLTWAKAEAEETCGDEAVAAHLESAIIRMRARFRLSDAEVIRLESCSSLHL